MSYTETEDSVWCKICHEKYQHLGSHIFHKHKVTARKYKTMFGLDYNLALISKEVYEKKRDRFNEHRKKYLKNIMGKNSEKYRFKEGQQKRLYFSKQSMDRAISQLKDINDEGNCPVCNQKFKHVGSHLFEKHGLVRVKNGK